MTANVSVAFFARAFYAVFVILPRSEKNSRRLRIFARLLDCLVVAFMLFVIGNEIYICYLTFGVFPLGFILSSTSGTLCSVGIRGTLMMKSEEIISAIHQISRSHRLAGLKRKDALILIAAFCCCWIMPCLMTFYDIQTVMSEYGDLMFQGATFYGWYGDAWWLTGLAFLVNSVNLQQLYALPGFCAVFCIYTTRLLSRAMTKAQRGIRAVKDLQQLLLYYLNMDQKLSQSLNNFNTAMSPMLLLLYCYFMSSIFIVMTMMVQRELQYAIIEELIFHLTVVVLSLSAFYAISTQGANVHRVAVEIERAINTSCLKLSSPIREQDEDLRFLLLTMTDGFEAKMQITVLNMFSLNRNFLLQTTGAMISYGIIIAQLGK